jgi:hypothetical protein
MFGFVAVIVASGAVGHRRSLSQGGQTDSIRHHQLRRHLVRLTVDLLDLGGRVGNLWDRTAFREWQVASSQYSSGVVKQVEARLPSSPSASVSTQRTMPFKVR